MPVCCWWSNMMSNPLARSMLPFFFCCLPIIFWLAALVPIYRITSYFDFWAFHSEPVSDERTGQERAGTIKCMVSLSFAFFPWRILCKEWKKKSDDSKMKPPDGTPRKRQRTKATISWCTSRAPHGALTHHVFSLVVISCDTLTHLCFGASV